MVTNLKHLIMVIFHFLSLRLFSSFQLHSHLITEPVSVLGLVHEAGGVHALVLRDEILTLEFDFMIDRSLSEYSLELWVSGGVVRVEALLATIVMKNFIRLIFH
jgi:hypothetical protein